MPNVTDMPMQNCRRRKGTTMNGHVRFLYKIAVFALYTVIMAAAYLGLKAQTVQAPNETAEGMPTTSAASDLAWWATQPPAGPDGRALPVSGTWASSPIASGWDAKYLMSQIEQGHHVLLTLEDPDWVAMTRGWSRGSRTVQQQIDQYYRPTLEFARAHNLPIAFRGWNLDDRVMDYDDWFTKSPAEEKPQVLENGKPIKLLDPFGPLKSWQTWGKFYGGNDVIQQLQQIYPNPPRVIFLSNNEGSQIRGTYQVTNNQDRFVAKFGAGPHAQQFIARAIREGYQERWAAAFQAVRDALVEPAWKKNVRFVFYNVLWDSGYIGSGNTNKPPRPGIWFDNEKGWLDWTLCDGAMPELYDNDWQPDKTDHTPTGMHMEAMNYYVAKERLLKEHPDYLWTAITWDGGMPNHAWSGHRAAGKTYTYLTRGERWDAARHEGWIQFCLWTTRPSVYFEFRGDEPRDAVRMGTWQALEECVDRPWNNAVLREFWRQGTLVPNTLEPEGHYYSLGPDHPQWLKDLDRWFLLTCDANPPRATLDWQKTNLRVFAEALMLGTAPNRRWLVYAHAPLGAVPNATVKLPGFGDVKLMSVPKSGSFFLVKEAGHSVQTLIAGGPDELSLVADRQWVNPGDSVKFTAAVAHAPNIRFTGFTWTFGDGATLQQRRVGTLSHRYAKAGDYLVSITGKCADGSSLSEQMAVFVGDKPANSVIYDLPLHDAFSWTGPWDDLNHDGTGLVTYRHVPNRGSAPNPVIVGGQFVDDAERGRVVELTEEYGGIFLKADQDTNLNSQGHPNKTISLWFKANDVVGRQLLYAEGSHFPGDDQAAGFNIYLDGGTIYAGSWSTRKHYSAWMHADGIMPGRWYHVALMLKDAVADVQPEKLHLYLDGTEVASAPGVRVPGTYGPPRVGRTRLNDSNVNESLTLFHDQKLNENLMRNVRNFQGRIAQFQLINDEVTP